VRTIARSSLSRYSVISSDLRYVTRGLRRRPAFATTAILSIGIGLAAATTVLSVFVALLARPLPYVAPAQLVAIWPDKGLASREVEALQQQMTTLAKVSSLSPGWLMSLTHVAVPRQLDAARLSGDLFALFGVPALIGRPFGSEAEVPGQDHVAVLSYDLWSSEFAGDASIVGKSIILDKEPYTVVAVMPRTFRAFAFTSDLWVPLPADHDAMWWTQATTFAFGRLRAGSTAQVASAELAAIAPRIRQDFQLAPDWVVGARVVGLQESMVGALRPTVLLLSGAVGLLLALATANVVTLLLVRTAERRGEMTVRAALGASPSRIAQLVAAEGMMIVLAGGALGVLLSRVGVSFLVGILPAGLPRREEIMLNGRVLSASAGLTLIVATIVAIVSLWQARGVSSDGRLRQSRTVSSAGERQRRVLVAVEMALALMLVIGATLMSRTIVALAHVDPGLKSDHLLTLKLQPDLNSDDEFRLYWEAVLSRVKAIPGVLSAATILHLPTSGRSWNASIAIEGRPAAPGETPPRAHWQVVSADYFRTARVQLLRGRFFDHTDGPKAPRVIAVNSAFADQLFPDIDPVGHRIRAGNATNDSLATIVAVVASVRHDSLTAPPTPEVYVPFAQRVVDANSVIVRTAVPPLSLVSEVRDQILTVDRNVPISDVRTMDDLLSASVARYRMVLILFTLFAGIGLLLSAVGVYGVVAFAATQRVKEIGIRMALGAHSAAILRLIVWEGLAAATLGAAAGLSIALGLSRVMRSMVYGVSPTDWVSFVLAPLGLIGVVIIASWMPARRAAALEPTVALSQ
jgi:putative ABC transport system permease protein